MPSGCGFAVALAFDLALNSLEAGVLLAHAILDVG
jgi:hypothetical protein